MSDLKCLAHDISVVNSSHVFGIPGSGKSLDLIDELERFDIKFIRTHFEGSAAIMAGTTGRLTGKPGVAVSIKGPGLTNMLPGLAVCHFEKFPVVAITEAYHPLAPGSKTHKRINHGELVSAVAKGSRFFAENGPCFSDMAKWAASEIPGPVLFELADAVVADENDIPQTINFCGSDISGYIARAKRPVIITGTLAIRLGWSEWLNNLSIPVFTTAAAKGVVNENLPHAAGVFTGTGLEHTPEYKIIPLSDLIIGVGLTSKEVLKAHSFHCDAVNICPLDDEFNDGAYKFLACHRDNLENLVYALSEKCWGLEETQTCLKNLTDYLLQGPFLPAHAFHVIERVFGEDVRIVLDTGDFCTIGEHIWRSKSASRFLSSGQGRYMGTSLPMGIAASLHDREIPTIVVTGDGGIGPFISEIKIAVENRLPLILILMTDGFFASIRGRAIRDGLTQKPLTINDSSWISVMEGFKVNSSKIDKGDSLYDIMASWRVENGPLYIEIPFESGHYEKMVRHIR